MTIAVLVALFATGAYACKTNSDCRQPGTRCVNADNPSTNFRFCGAFQTPDSKTFPTVELGQGSQQPKRGVPNRAATGESCKSDRDCPSGKLCTRPNSNSGWRCVVR